MSDEKLVLHYRRNGAGDRWFVLRGKRYTLVPVIGGYRILSDKTGAYSEKYATFDDARAEIERAAVTGLPIVQGEP